MTAQIIPLPRIRRERADKTLDVTIGLEGERLAKVGVIASQLDRSLDEVAMCLLYQAIDKLDSRILATMCSK